MNKDNLLKELEDQVLVCKKCPLGLSRQRAVFGEGDANAGIVLIGEGPGAEEDKQGRPFVGKAGQLLDKILFAAGFNRNNVYIGNIVKCRPPQNRVPTAEERLTCIPYLKEQIKIIEPQIIVLLGATALQGMIDSEAKISKMRGNWQYWESLWVMPTYHPAALLRNPNLKRYVWEDFKQIVAKYRELVDKDHQAPYC